MENSLRHQIVEVEPIEVQQPLEKGVSREARPIVVEVSEGHDLVVLGPRLMLGRGKDVPPYHLGSFRISAASCISLSLLLLKDDGSHSAIAREQGAPECCRRAMRKTLGRRQ